MSLSQQIVEKQAALVAARDVLVDVTSKMGEDDASQLAVDAATQAVQKATAELDRLKEAESAIQKSLARNTSAAISSNPAARVKDSDKADLLVKSALCAFESYVKRVPVEHVVASRYGDDEVVKTVVGLTTKAAQNPAMTSVPAWAGVLVRDSYAAFMDLLRPESVVPRLPLSTHEFNGYGTIKIPARTANTPNLAGAFRAEGAPIRVGALALTSITLTPKSLGVIGSFTAEMLERSTPSIEAIIRDAMVQDTAAALDIAFLGNIAGTAIQPAGIQTYATGGNTAASAGTTSANLIADVRGRMQAMTAAGMGRRPVWVMNPARWFGAQLSVTAAGTPTFPEAASGTILGLPVVTSTSVPPAVVFLIDAAEVSFAGGAPRFLGTDVATFHEEDTTPLPIADAGATAGGSATGVGNGPVRSLFQTNSAALRAVWEVDWAVMRPNGAVQTITAAAW